MRIRPVETSGLPMPFQRRGQGPVIVGSPDPLAWANKADGAKHAWDFIANAARWNGQYIGALANTPNWTFTRASTGYAQTAAGALTAFASGELRRTDKGVLIEGAGTNLCLQSQTFDNASWTKTTVNVTADAAAAPDGTTTADLLYDDSSAGAQHRLTSGNLGAYTVASTLTASVFIKAASGRNVAVRLAGASGSAYAVFSASTGALVTSTTTGSNWSVTSTSSVALANGWYRVSLVAAHTETSGNLQLLLNLASGSNITYDGDGASGAYLWGAQLEAKAYASSYVPTTTASATRAADSLTVAGVSGLDYPLTLYAEFERAVDTGGTEEYLSVRQTNNNERVRAGISSSDLAFVQANAGGVDQGLVSVAGAISTGVVTKVAARCAANSLIVAKSGTLSAEDTSVTVPATPNEITFVGTANVPFGYLRRAALFSRALSDGELQALTAA